MFNVFNGHENCLRPIFEDYYKNLILDSHLNSFFSDIRMVKNIMEGQISQFQNLSGETPATLSKQYKDFGRMHANMGISYSSLENASDYLLKRFSSYFSEKSPDRIDSLNGLFSFMETSMAYGYIEYEMETFIDSLRRLSKYASDTKNLKDFAEWFLMLHSAMINEDIGMSDMLVKEMPTVDMFVSSAPDLSDDLAHSFKEFRTQIKILFNTIEKKDSKGTLSSYTRLKEIFFTMLYIMSILEQQAMSESFAKDPLTGALTRKQMDSIIERSLAESSATSNPFSLALADIDHFKKVNDTYGHDAGDIVLKEFSKILMEHTSDAGGVVIRYGGEEFLIIFPMSNKEDAKETLENVRLVIEMTPFNIGSKIIHITSSFGVTETCGSERKSNPLEIVKEADNNLYTAKENGRNQIVG